MVNNIILNSPEGMKSYLPETAQEFEEIKNKINEVFKLWGYRPVITPTLEYYDSLLLGMGQNTKKEFYKMIDYEGNVLALRPEMTAPIARTFVNRMGEFDLPLRLSYSAPVYRYDSPQMGKNREIYQMGVEFIGENSLADAEALIIAIEAIKNTGIENFKLDLGHTGYLDGILSGLNLQIEEEKKLKSLLIKKDFVGLKEYINGLNIENRALLLELPLLRGDIEILDKAAKLVTDESSRAAITRLREVYNYLGSYDVAEYVNFDLGLIRGLNYYTGIVFEGFTERLGYTICGGGRYDNLIAQFGGESTPAVGFAVGLERLRLSLKKQGHDFSGNKIDGLIVFPPEVRKTALGTAKKLHKKGLSIIIRETEKTNQDLISSASKKGVKRIISFQPYKEEGRLEIINIETENKSKVEIGEGWETGIWKK